MWSRHYKILRIKSNPVHLRLLLHTVHVFCCPILYFVKSVSCLFILLYPVISIFLFSLQDCSPPPCFPFIQEATWGMGSAQHPSENIQNVQRLLHGNPTFCRSYWFYYMLNDIEWRLKLDSLGESTLITLCQSQSWESRTDASKIIIERLLWLFFLFYYFFSTLGRRTYISFLQKCLSRLSGQGDDYNVYCAKNAFLHYVPAGCLLKVVISYVPWRIAKE